MKTRHVIAAIFSLVAHSATSSAYTIKELEAKTRVKINQIFPSQLDKNLEMLNEAKIAACLQKFDESAKRIKPVPRSSKSIKAENGVIECGRYVGERVDEELKKTYTQYPGCWAHYIPDDQPGVPTFIDMSLWFAYDVSLGSAYINSKFDGDTEALMLHSDAGGDLNRNPDVTVIESNGKKDTLLWFSPPFHVLNKGMAIEFPEEPIRKELGRRLLQFGQICANPS